MIILSCLNCSEYAVEQERAQICYDLCFKNYKGTKAWYRDYHTWCTCEIDQKPYVFKVPQKNDIKNRE